jgi:hypothetical protein
VRERNTGLPPFDSAQTCRQGTTDEILVSGLKSLH